MEPTKGNMEIVTSRDTEMFAKSLIELCFELEV